MSAPEITLFPKDAERPDQIKGFVRGGEFFHIGDRVMLKHRPSGSRLFGTLGGTYGISRIRGFKVSSVPFGLSNALYPIGQPGDEMYGLTLVERCDAAYDIAKAHFVKHDGTAEEWDAVTDFAQEVYLAALAQEGKL